MYSTTTTSPRGIIIEGGLMTQINVINSQLPIIIVYWRGETRKKSTKMKYLLMDKTNRLFSSSQPTSLPEATFFVQPIYCHLFRHLLWWLSFGTKNMLGRTSSVPCKSVPWNKNIVRRKRKKERKRMDMKRDDPNPWCCVGLLLLSWGRNYWRRRKKSVTFTTAFYGV